MLPDAFAYAIFRFTRRTPFRSFAVEFTSGSLLVVAHPEAVFWRGPIYFHIDPRGLYQVFDHTGVARVLDLREDVPVIDESMYDHDPEGDPDDD